MVFMAVYPGICQGASCLELGRKSQYIRPLQALRVTAQLVDTSFFSLRMDPR